MGRMSWVYIEDLPRHVGEEVTLRGWLYNKRSSGKIHFLLVRDGTGLCQCVASKGDLGDEAFAAADHMGQETSLEVTGTVREDKRAPGGFELTVASVKQIAPSADYPITPKEHGVAFLLDKRHLWVRSSRQHAILRIRSEVAQACRDFFAERGFVLFDAPILTPTSCEGTTNLFELDYFEDRKAYLTQSGQLYAEAGALALGKVYCFGPTFRAEKSKTRRHLTEFWMVEPEAAYFNLDDDMALAEDFVSYIVRRVLERRAPELKDARARRLEARSLDENSLSANHVRRGDRALESQGRERQLGRRFWRRRGDDALERVRSPGDGASLPDCL